MDCGNYYADNGKPIIMYRNGKNFAEIDYIHKTYSSVGLSYVLFCYKCNRKNEADCINIYDDNERNLDELINIAISTNMLVVDKYDYI